MVCKHTSSSSLCYLSLPPSSLCLSLALSTQPVQGSNAEPLFHLAILYKRYTNMERWGGGGGGVAGSGSRARLTSVEKRVRQQGRIRAVTRAFMLHVTPLLLPEHLRCFV